VPVLAAHRRDLGEGWQEVVVPMSELNPGRQQFDRLIFRAFRQVANGKVLLDQIGFTAVDEAKEAAERAAILGRARPAPMAVDCRARATRISPFIYGTAGHGNPAPAQQWKLDFAARRWGGNPTSTYNWQLHAWNTGSDWFFENVGVPPYTSFLDQNRQHRTESFLTVPIMGWVAKDDASSSFRRDLVPGQARFDQWRPKAGDGRTADGKPLPAGPPTRTFVPAPPDFIAGWVKAIRARDAATGTRSVREYILDNEPMLWSSTHRGAHPEPVTYDELLDRTIRYATAIREVDPEALIAGPALWGWPAYHYSGLDAADNFRSKPDYRAHGSTFLLPWWLKRLQAHEQKTGKKLVDVVDVHFYPQAQGVYSEAGDAVAALRIRSTRALWDPTYDDESWIADRIELIPLLKRWIAENNPGLKIQIGEWSFGGEKHPSGGLATAEALGRFGALGVFAAFYWTLPPDGSPAFQAFRAYLDFDGAGGRFLDHSLPASAAPGTSLFASRDAEGKRAVLVVLNFSPTEAIAPALDLAGCGPVTGRRTFIYEPGGPGFALTDRPGGEVPPLPPSSISVVELHFGQVMPGALD
jgi:hypothetical protein